MTDLRTLRLPVDVELHFTHERFGDPLARADRPVVDDIVVRRYDDLGHRCRCRLPTSRRTNEGGEEIELGGDPTPVSMKKSAGAIAEKRARYRLHA